MINNAYNAYANPSSLRSVANSPTNERSDFFRRTYIHLAGALFALVALEALIFSLGIAPILYNTFMGGRWSWLIVLGAFTVVSMLANKWAHSDTSEGMQYLGLSVYVVAEAFILAPLLYMAHVAFPGKNPIAIAGIITLFLFLALTVIAFITKADFSFMKGFLAIAGIVAFGAIVVSIIFQFNLGIWFSAGMCLLMGGFILYTTSNIIHHYNPRQHVAASLALFASIATLFWYVLRVVMFFMSNRD